MNLYNNKTLVTGCATGIELSTAFNLEGNTVIICKKRQLVLDESIGLNFNVNFLSI